MYKIGNKNLPKKLTVKFKKYFALITIVFISLGLLGSLALVEQNQDIRKHAEERNNQNILKTNLPITYEMERVYPELVNPENPDWSRSKFVLETPLLPELVSDPKPITVKVLAIIYDTHLVNRHYPYRDPVELNQLLAEQLENASREKGYAQLSYPKNVNIRIANTIIYKTPSPLLEGKSSSGAADYNAILNQNNVCNQINSGEIDEVWLWADRTGGYWEAITAGPQNLVFNTNGPPLVRNDCERLFSIMGLNYERYYDWRPKKDGTYEFLVPSVGSELHSFGHRIENTISHFLDGSNRYYAGPGTNWYEYDGQKGYLGTLNKMRYCGNVHWTPNSNLLKKDQYNYSNKVLSNSDCNNWNPAHSGSKQTISCSTWGCWEESYFLWWMQNFPGRCTSIGMKKTSGQPMPNWWKLIFKYNSEVEKSTCKPITTSPTPTKPLTPTPTPT